VRVNINNEIEIPVIKNIRLSEKGSLQIGTFNLEGINGYSFDKEDEKKNIITYTNSSGCYVKSNLGYIKISQIDLPPRNTKKCYVCDMSASDLLPATAGAVNAALRKEMVKETNYYCGTCWGAFNVPNAHTYDPENDNDVIDVTDSPHTDSSIIDLPAPIIELPAPIIELPAPVIALPPEKSRIVFLREARIKVFCPKPQEPSGLPKPEEPSVETDSDEEPEIDPRKHAPRQPIKLIPVVDLTEDEEVNDKEVNDEEVNDKEVNDKEVNDKEVNDKEVNDEVNDEEVNDEEVNDNYDPDEFGPIDPDYTPEIVDVSNDEPSPKRTKREPLHWSIAHGSNPYDIDRDDIDRDKIDLNDYLGFL
jgi:hypothetical protein